MNMPLSILFDAHGRSTGLETGDNVPVDVIRGSEK